MCWEKAPPTPAQPSRLSLLSHISPAPRSLARQRYFYQGYKSPIQPASPSFSAVSRRGKTKPLTCQLPACHRSQVSCCTPADMGWGPACLAASRALGMDNSLGAPGMSNRMLVAPPSSQEGMGWTLGTLSQLFLSLNSSLLSHQYFTMLSVPSPPSFTFFLPSYPVFPPCLPTLPCQFNPPLLCLAFPGSRCQAFTFRTLPSEELIWSWLRAVGTARTPAPSLEAPGLEGKMGKGLPAAPSTASPEPTPAQPGAPLHLPGVEPHVQDLT